MCVEVADIILSTTIINNINLHIAKIFCVMILYNTINIIVTLYQCDNLITRFFWVSFLPIHLLFNKSLKFMLLVI